jgi:branched-chain amino acid transport system substrate-binding protein
MITYFDSASDENNEENCLETMFTEHFIFLTNRCIIGYYMKKKLFIIAITTLITLTTIAILPTISSVKPQTIQIGVVLPSEEDFEHYLPVFEEIIEPDINEYVRKLPRMRFKPDLEFEFLLEHGHSDPGIHLEKVQYFASIGVDLIIGGFWSSQAEYAMDYANEHQMLLISPSSTAPSLAISGDVLYRLAPDDTKQSSAIAEMIKSKGMNKVIVLHTVEFWGNWSCEYFVDQYEQIEGEILGVLPYNASDPDYDALLDDAELLVTGSDVGVVLFSGGEAADILAEAYYHGGVYDLPWFGGESTAMNQHILEFAPEEAAHVKLYSTLLAPDQSSKYREISVRYDAVLGAPPDYYSLNVIDAAWILAQTVLEARPSHPVKMDATDVMEVLPDVASRYYGYSGWTHLNEAGDRANPYYEIWGYKFEGGEGEFILSGFYDYPNDEIFWYDS